MQRNNDALSASEIQLRDGSITRLFYKFALPGVVGLLFLGIQTIIDGIIIGRYMGANALASVSLVLPCYSFMTALAISLGVGCQTVVSTALGATNRSRANNALVSATIFMFAFTLVAATFITLFAPSIARFLGANETLLPESVAYIRSLVPFFPIMAVMFLCDYILKAIGKPIYAMSVMASTVVINIVLDILFVGLWKMGTGGAGLASGIAFSAGCAASLPIVLRQRRIVNIFQGRFRWKLTARMLYNGSSEGIAELSSGITILLFNITMMKYLGETGVAAFTALEYILFLCITVFLGVSDGVIPIISYNYGNKNRKRIGDTFLLALRTNMIIGIVFFLIITLFGREIIAIFFDSAETNAIEIAVQGSAIYAFAFLFNGLNILASSYFTALSDAKTSVIISLLRGIVLVAPCVLILPLVMGINGVWLAIPLAEILTLIVSAILILRSKKRHAWI